MAAILLSFLMLVRLLPMDSLVKQLETQVNQLGIWGPVVFGAAYLVGAVFFVPGSALTLAAGGVFGLVLGTVVVSIASTSAAAVAFLIGRYLARGTVLRWAEKNPKFAAIDRAIGQGGWKIIAMLRLSPAMPFSLGNYLFGLTSIRFWPYVLTSWVAMLPGTFMYVYLGYAAREATAGGSRTPGQWALLGVGLVATLSVTVYVTRLARKAIKESSPMSDDSIDPATPIPEAAAPQKRFLATAITASLALMLSGCTVWAYMNRTMVSGLFGPPTVTSEETYEEKLDGPTFDHSHFDALLKKHVSDSGQVNYVGLKKDADELDAYIARLAEAPMEQMGRNQRLALLINGYNAFTLRLILDNYPLASIKDIPTADRWAAKRWSLGGKTLSLSQIENEEVRPNFKEPRIHFALVCAAIGCPPLRNEAYQADRLEEQLNEQSIYVHTHDRWFQYNDATGTLQLTALYNWYGGDFEQAAGTVVKFAARYSPSLQKALDEGRKPTVTYLDYDWSLNDGGNPAGPTPEETAVVKPAAPTPEEPAVVKPADPTPEEPAVVKPADPALAPAVFDALLKKYVSDAGRVDYAGLKTEAKQLDAYMAWVAEAPIKGMGRDERLALLINAYNAFTLRLILDHYPMKSIQEIPKADRWAAKRWSLGGKTLSLSQIENEEVRPNFKEPRIHFALVCAALGCPPLRNEAYQADLLEEQLNEQSIYVHTHDRWFQYNDATGTLQLTALYNWYGGDFEQAAGTVVKFAARYSPSLQKALDEGRKPTVTFLPYDWSLNDKVKP